MRVNAAGANLNREWASGVYEGYDAPSLERSPLGQAFHVRDLVGRGDADLLERPAGRFLRLRRR